MTEKGAELHPVNRVRQETLRTLLKGLKAVLDEGCVVKRVTVIPVSGSELKARARRIGELHRADADTPSKKAPGKPGRKPSRPRKRGESDAEKKKRLARERAQRYRANKKASRAGEPKGRKGK